MISELIAAAPSMADLSNEDLAERILDALMGLTKAEIREAIRDAVISEVRLQRRYETRSIEHSGGTPADSTKGRRDLLDQSFFVSPERGYVTWGDATIDDHLTRAAFLRHQAAGTIATAEKHERTVKLLRAKSAKCLYELSQDAA